MRGYAVALATVFLMAAPPAGAQSGVPAEEESPTAEQFIETAREVYSVREKRIDPCPAPVGNEIVVCRRREDPDSLRVASPTERAQAAGEMPPDPIPSAPDLYGGMRGGVIVAKGCFIPPCPPPFPPIIDLEAIPEPLTPEEAARVFRAEEPANPAAASPAAVP